MDLQHCTNADRHNKIKYVHFGCFLLHKMNVIWQYNMQLLSVYVHSKPFLCRQIFLWILTSKRSNSTFASQIIRKRLHL